MVVEKNMYLSRMIDDRNDRKMIEKWEKMVEKNYRKMDVKKKMYLSKILVIWRGQNQKKGRRQSLTQNSLVEWKIYILYHFETCSWGLVEMLNFRLKCENCHLRVFPLLQDQTARIVMDSVTGIQVNH